MRRWLVILLVLGSPIQSWAAIALVQSTTGTTANYASTTLAYGSNVVAGNLLVVTGAAWNGSSITDVVITDTVGSSWTTVMGCVTGSTPNVTWISYAIAAASGANTVTIDPNSGGAYSSHSISEWSGISAVPLDVNGGCSTGSSTTASDGMTTSAADTVVIGVMSQGSGSAHALTEDSAGGWTLLQENESAANAPYATAYQIFSSAGATTASWTIAASVAWAAQTASFKAQVDLVGCYIMENNTDYYLMENNTDRYALEGGDGGLCGGAPPAATHPGWSSPGGWY